MGINNYETKRLSGEDFLLQRIFTARASFPRTVLDVGANVGKYSSRIKQFDPDAIIYAFEPHPKTFQRLYKAATRDGYTAVHAGLSDSAGHMQLYDYADQDRSSSHATFYHDVIETLNRRPAQQWEVPVMTIDAFVEQEQIEHIHLLKVDTEGHEIYALRGALRLIQRGAIDMIQFEFDRMNTYSRTFFKDFYDLLPMYDFYRLLPQSVLPLGPYEPVFCELFAYQNILAIHRDHKSFVRTQYRLLL
jgi:FkbM family methyltransferase